MYSFCSSLMAFSVNPSKSWLLIESISGAVYDAQYFPALSARSESLWNKSMIFQTPHPGWVGEEPLLFIKKQQLMSPLRLSPEIEDVTYIHLLGLSDLSAVSLTCSRH